MKYLILILSIGLQLLLVPGAQAWSPLDFNRLLPVDTVQCQFVVAGDENSEGTNNNEESEEEEEPDCD